MPVLEIGRDSSPSREQVAPDAEWHFGVHDCQVGLEVARHSPKGAGWTERLGGLQTEGDAAFGKPCSKAAAKSLGSRDPTARGLVQRNFSIFCVAQDFSVEGLKAGVIRHGHHGYLVARLAKRFSLLSDSRVPADGPGGQNEDGWRGGHQGAVSDAGWRGALQGASQGAGERSEIAVHPTGRGSNRQVLQLARQRAGGIRPRRDMRCK